MGACPNPVALLIHPNTLLQIAECNLMTATVTQLFTLTNAFIVEQNLYSALSVADRAYVIDQGAIRWMGTPDELRGNHEILSRYLHV